MKRLPALLLAVTLAFPANLARGEDMKIDAGGIRLIVNGAELTDLPAPPVLYDGHTLVPAREVFENLGAVVDWKPETREIYVGYGSRLLVIEIDSDLANVDGVTTPMAAPPKIINGKTMIPLRFVSESFGFQVDWDTAARVVSVSSGGKAVTDASAPPTLDLAVLEQLAGGDPDAARNQQETQPETQPQLPAQSVTEPPQETQPQAAAAAGETDAPARDISDGPIPAIDAPPTEIVAVDLPGLGGGAFTVRASSAIGRVEKTLMPDNRLILDFYNADMSLPQAQYTVTHSGVRSVRGGQFQTEPVKIARVVFDLMGGATFKVGVSEDRMAVTVDLERNTVTDAELATDGAADVLTLRFSGGPAATAYPLANPDRIVVDAPGAEMAKLMNSPQNGRFVSNIRTEQADASTARVTLDLKDIASFSVSTQGNTMTVRLTEPTYRNIRYDAAAKTLSIKKNPAIAMQPGQWRAEDRYGEMAYTLAMPGDFAAVVGYGDYLINDEYIAGVTIRNNAAGQTELLFRENQVLAFDVTEDAENIHVKAMLPKEKYRRIVVLDAGHGGTDEGTAHNGCVEKDITFDVANRLAALLEAEGSVKVYRSRTTDFKVPLEDRPVFANGLGDLFVSIHCDSAYPNTTANGTTTYYYPHDNDAAIGISTKRTAEIIQRAMIAALGSTDRGAQQSGFYVIKYTKMPSVLVEMGFVSNPEEAAKLASDAYRQTYAEALFQGILMVFQQYTPPR